MQVKKWRQLFPVSMKDTLITLGILVCAVVMCLVLRLFDDGDTYVSMIFLLAVSLISRMTAGYLYGTLSSVVSVFCVNYLFSYPYLKFDLSEAGYPITFLSMLLISIIISMMTTQIKQQERLKTEAEKEKMRSNLLRAVSHDLRTPLTSILGASSAILDNDAAIDQRERTELLQEIQEDAQWLIRMVENLLSVTRISEDTTKIHKQPQAVEEIVAESLEKFHKRFSGIPIHVKVPDALLMVPMDAILIEQVLINLLENAVLHGKTTTHIAISVTATEKDAVFTVTDNGKGIPHDAMPYLFEGYLNKAETTESDKHRNMGIGLSVCMSIIKAHGGTMHAANRKQGGAVFTFTLPLKEEVLHA